MNYKHHIIHNFPKNYPFLGKVFANIIYFIGGIIIHHRDNWLTKKDLKEASKTLKKGDVILVGGLRKANQFFINAPITHCAIYAGNRMFIHSVCDGVEIDSFHEVFCEYDTLIILRLKEKHKNLAKKMVKYAKKQIGKPYAFDFKMGTKKFFCSALIHYALKNVGLNPKNYEKSHHRSRLRPNVLHPMDFIGGDFKTVFKSHNLKIKGTTVKLIEEVEKKSPIKKFAFDPISID